MCCHSEKKELVIAISLYSFVINPLSPNQKVQLVCFTTLKRRVFIVVISLFSAVFLLIDITNNKYATQKIATCYRHSHSSNLYATLLAIIST